MKTYFKILVILFLVSVAKSWAGYEVGNGGSVVVCQNPNTQQESIELLDVYEERMRSRLSVEEFERLYNKQNDWYKLISDNSPRRGLLYNYYLKNFYSEALFVNEKMRLTNDYGEDIVLPLNCRLEQLVTQIARAHPFDSVSWVGRYKINSVLWSKMSLLNKNASVLHEIIYRERISQCVEFKEGKCFPESFSLNSKEIRKLVGFYIKGTIEHSTRQYVNKLLLDAGLRRIENQGLVFVDNSHEGMSVLYSHDPYVVEIDLENLFVDKLYKKNKIQFGVKDFFGAEFMGSPYYVYISLVYQNYKILVPSDFVIEKKGKEIKISNYSDTLNIVNFYKNGKQINYYLKINEIIISPRSYIKFKNEKGFIKQIKL